MTTHRIATRMRNVRAGLAAMRNRPSLELRPTGVPVPSHVRLPAAERGRAPIDLQVLEAERLRLVRTLHDGPLQALAAAIIRLELSRASPQEIATLREVEHSLRRIAIELRPPVLDDIGLSAAIASHVDNLASPDVTPQQPSIHLNIRASWPGDTKGRPPEEVETAAFRVIQEGIANAVRHSGASEIDVHGTVDRAHVDISVDDDGRGINLVDVRRAQRAGRFGLFTMAERAASAGASFNIHARSPRGTRLRFDWREAL